MDEPLLFDVHCHVLETPEQIDTIPQLKTKYLALMSAKVEDWSKVHQIHSTYPNRTVPCFGIHPWFATQTLQHHSSTWLETLRSKLLEVPNSIVGEIGLDKVAKNDQGEIYSWEDQLTVFLAQWNLAVELNRPISMHAVHISGFLLDFFRSQAKLGELHWPPKIMLHSFNGSTDLRSQLLKLKGLGQRLYFSFSMTIQQRNIEKMETWLKMLSTSQILIESDVHQCNQVDEAMQLMYSKIETCLGKPVAEQCYQNAMTFFFNN